MAVPFYLPEGGADDTISSGPSTSTNGTNSNGTSTTSSTSSSPYQTSPNTTSSATQTPVQSPLMPGDLVMALCEAFYRYSINTGTPVFQYPTVPLSPSCSMHSPSYTGGDIFFPRSRSTPRTPRTSVSFAAGDEVNFFHQSSPATATTAAGGAGGAAVSGCSNVAANANTSSCQTENSANNNNNSNSNSNSNNNSSQLPQSAPPVTSITTSQQHHIHFPLHPRVVAFHHAAGCYQCTPPPTPTTATASTSTGTSTGGTIHRHLHRSLSDTARRLRLTSTGEDEREYQSEHETSWDELDERFDNFTAGRERLQEFNGRIPPRKKKKDNQSKPRSEKKEQSFTWPAVVTVFVFAMGCGFLVAR